MSSFVGKIPPALAVVGKSLQTPLLLVIRLFWGWQFAQTGWGKLTHLSATGEFFQSLGIPFPTANAAVAGTVECLGGLMLILGFYTRLACLPLIATMLVAYFTADREAITSIWEKPDAFLAATPFLFLFASVILFAFGPGRWSLDGWRGAKES